MKPFDDTGMWLIDSGEEGAGLCISVGIHGDERLPVEAVTQLVAMFSTDELGITDGRLLLIVANVNAVAAGRRWTEDGVDLGSCFESSILSGKQGPYEERRARDIARCIEQAGIEILVDLHSTAVPGRRFVVQHTATCPRHLEVTELLRSDAVVLDPASQLEASSIHGWMHSRGQVGVHYDTGSTEHPETTALFIRDEIINLMAGLGMMTGRAYRRHRDDVRLRVDGVVHLRADDFHWREGMGENLQSLAAGAVLGAYGDGGQVVLEEDAVLVFPRQAAELLKEGEPLVYLARTASP